MKNNMSSSPYYTVVRPSNCLDRMFYLQYRVGAQSNVLVSAHYAPTTSSHDRLPKEAVYSAIYSIIETYPELSLIAVQKASKNRKQHRLLLAAMHEIDLETCVEFHDDEEPVASPKVIERLHNEWCWTDEQFNPRKPLWKVVVLGGREVVFVFHHMICDGRFAQIFHREFLATINSFDQDHKPSSHIVKVDPERVKLGKETKEFWTSSSSIIRIIHVFLMLILLRFFVGRRLLFTNLPKPKEHTTSVLIEAGPDNRTKTRVATIRISATTMRCIIAACRERKTTFTPLLIVMILSTLACDYYPEAKVGISNCSLDMRSLYPQEEDGGRLLQCAGGTSKLTWLDRYRQVYRSESSEKGHIIMDIDRAWQLVKDYRAAIVKAIEGKEPPVLVTFRAGNAMADDLEGMLKSTFPALGLHLNNCVQVSNLGSFSAAEQNGQWKIHDMSFSASTVNGNISYNLAVHVAGVEGGDTVVNVSYEYGIFTEEMITGVLEGALGRIQAMVY
ncbi:alcohol acetyltransferase [Dactylonectria estremocensis]|uniref:Alcohol acetyltransferase n=1 Tax=Dactylonectria estremocensis TaxID=1079267 RepID=A0A9P9J1X5_9HYPO|nr:alcohol acetyltransferase [Dactylonectria estremocensis]